MHSTSHITGENEPVAIVGMGCRFAGGVRDTTELWKLLKEKRDAWSEFNNPRGFTTQGFYHPNHERPGSMTTKGGYVLDEDPRLFDHAFFGITGREAETMDPSQRKLLEVVYEALESGGETLESISGSHTGVYIGNFALDHLLMQSRDWESPKPYSATGADSSILGNRVSYIFNLKGPSLTTTTACSSSMYALHIAVQAIRNGECESAIVAAANCLLDPTMQMVLDKLGALSPTSRCHTFDAAADGYARGEGYAALYLKKTSVALADKSPIRAMIRGTAVNANGRTGGIARPSIDGQEAVIRKAYENAGNLPFCDTTFFECHGTGTQAGDPIEVSALSRVFSPTRSDDPSDRLFVGAIKTNIGHTEGASALASVMKAVLCMEAGEIPPSYGIETLNPSIDFDLAKVEVVKDGTVPWPTDRLRRSSVNSFGFGGANGHCIIDHVNVVLPHYVKPGVMANPPKTNGYEQKNGYHEISCHPQLSHLAPIAIEKTMKADAGTRNLVLLPFSAHNASSLTKNINALSVLIGKWPLADVAYTLSCKRSKLQHRSFRIVDQVDPQKGLLDNPNRTIVSSRQTAKLCFIFTGQGAQWHAMGAQLLDYAVFRRSIAYLDSVIYELEPNRSLSIRDILSGSCEESFIQRAEISQTACTAIQIGLVDLLGSWSVRPKAVAGHSSGEIAAAYASGRITAAEAIVVAYSRGQAVARNKRRGAMLAVGLSEQDIIPIIEGLEGTVRLAAINSPQSLTLSGDLDAIGSVSIALTNEGIFNRRLRTGGNAYHSHHMIEVGESYVDFLERGLAKLQKFENFNSRSTLPFADWVSSVTPDKPFGCNISPSYWRANLESPVQFDKAVGRLLISSESDIEAFVEIGPHSALKGPLDQISKAIGKEVPHVPSLKRQEDNKVSMLRTAGILFSLNATIDLIAVNALEEVTSSRKLNLIHGCTAVDMPTYQYTYESLNYYESRQSKEFRLRKTVRHDLLGSKVLGVGHLRPQWRNVLRIKDLPWLNDHLLWPDACLPVTCLMAMAMEGAKQMHQESNKGSEIYGYTIRDLKIKSALVIPDDDEGVEIVFSMSPVDANILDDLHWMSFSTSSVTPDSSWSEHCTGYVRVELTANPSGGSIDRTSADWRTPSLDSWYKCFSKLGIVHGTTFRSISDLRTDPTRDLACARVSLDTTAGVVNGGESKYAIHPTALDGVLQLGLISCFGGQVERANTAFVPLHFDQIHINNNANNHPCVGTARCVARTSKHVELSLQLHNEFGEVVFHVDKLTSVAHRGPKVTDDSKYSAFYGPFARLAWKPDFRTLNNQVLRALFPPPQENLSRIQALERVDLIVCLVVAEIHNEYIKSGAELNPPIQLRQWVMWVKRMVERDPRENMTQARNRTSSERRRLLSKLYQEAGRDVEARAAKLVHENIGAILQGQRTGLDVLVPNNLLTEMYQEGHMLVGAYPQLLNVMDCLSHSNPNLRILEIGAGTGGATRVIMKSIAGPGRMKRYASYTFTDISPGFLTSAHSSMSSFQDMDFSVLDIERDPAEQGFGADYDVVVASQAIHATACMSVTLENCRKLLKPGGHLVLVEATRMRVLPGLLYGIMTGYWLGIDDDRAEGPFMDLDRWDRRLRDAGFSGTEMHLDDYPEPYTTTSVIVSTLQPQEATNLNHSPKTADSVYIMHGSQDAPALAKKISLHLKNLGFTTYTCSLDDSLDKLPQQSRIIALLDGEYLLVNADEQPLKILQNLVHVAKSMICLTCTGLIKGRNPYGALVVGLIRTIGTENPEGQFVSIDIDAENFEFDDDVLSSQIVDKEIAFHSEQKHDDLSQDREFTWQDGCMWVSRVVSDDSFNAYTNNQKTPANSDYELIPLGTSKPLNAQFEVPGIPSSLFFQTCNDTSQTLPLNYIEVRVEAAGLNKRDLEVLAGNIRPEGDSLATYEYAGVITKTGDDVVGLSIGDLVYGIGPGFFGNRIRAPANLARRRRKEDSAVNMASLPIAYMNAVYALDNIAQIGVGQRVLINSAGGAVGLAVVGFALHRKAKFRIIMESSEEQAFVMEKLGVPPSNFITQHEAHLTFGSDAFDIILNIGKPEDECLKYLAPMGHLITVDGLQVDINWKLVFRRARYFALDLEYLMSHKPAVCANLLDKVHELYHDGSIKPILPLNLFDISNLSGALAEFSKSRLYGKTVISFKNKDSLLKVLRTPRTVAFDPKATYIITGGFGGIGRSIIRWMAHRGARDVVVLSRRGATTAEALRMIEDMKSHSVLVKSLKCDVSNREDVITAVNQENRRKSVKGVIHAALELSDLSFDKLTTQKWQKGTSAKVQGTANLHEATAGLDLDFFIMTTSTESIWAPPTQSTYMAATNFQEMFARYRRRLGLPASTIAFGLVEDLGSDWREGSSGTMAMYERNKVLTMTEHHVLATLEPAFFAAPDTPEHEGNSSQTRFLYAQDPLAVANIFTCLDPAAIAAKEETTKGTPLPRWYGDGRVCIIMRAVRDAQKTRNSSNSSEDIGGQGAVSAATSTRQAFEKAIASAPDSHAETIEFVTEAISTTMAEMLFVSKMNINPLVSVAVHGVDSLIAAELRNWFYQALGAKVKTLQLLDEDKSIVEIAREIVNSSWRA